MASTSSPTLPLTKLESPFLSPQAQRGNSISIARPIMLSSPIHFFHYNFNVSHQSSKLSGLKSHGFFVFSFASNYSVSGSQIDEGKRGLSDDGSSIELQVQSSMWNWKGYSIRYQYAGNSGPALVLVHGFGANRNMALGKFFFRSVATSESVRNILCQVTEELVQKILLRGLEPGAADVFLEFIFYSRAPLPEELPPQVKCPVLIAWGDNDPWEPIELGRVYGNFASVEDFVILPNVGHCPRDEAPHLVNPLVESFVAHHATPASNVSTVV